MTAACKGARRPVAVDRSPFGGTCSVCGAAVHTYKADRYDDTSDTLAADHEREG